MYCIVLTRESLVGGTGLVAGCFDFGRCSLKEQIYSSLVVRLHKVESVCIEKRKLGGSDSVSGSGIGDGSGIGGDGSGDYTIEIFK